MSEISAKDLKDKILEILESKNAVGISSIDLEGQTSIADYFVIATGKNPNHTRTLADTVEDKLAEEGIDLIRKEGVSDARWIVLDYSFVIVHIFNSETRDFYCLESLWKK